MKGKEEALMTVFGCEERGSKQRTARKGGGFGCKKGEGGRRHLRLWSAVKEEEAGRQRAAREGGEFGCGQAKGVWVELGRNEKRSCLQP